jgi:hypothetical protein
VHSIASKKIELQAFTTERENLGTSHSRNDCNSAQWAKDDHYTCPYTGVNIGPFRRNRLYMLTLSTRIWQLAWPNLSYRPERTEYRTTRYGSLSTEIPDSALTDPQASRYNTRFALSRF